MLGSFSKSFKFKSAISSLFSVLKTQITGQKPTVSIRPVIFSKEKISLRVRALKGKYLVQDRNITLGEEGCMVFDFVDQMKDHEGIAFPKTQVNFNSRIPFRISLNEVHKFFEVDPFFARDKKIEIEYRKGMTGERKRLGIAWNKDNSCFDCELKVAEPVKNVDIKKQISLSDSDFFFIQELMRVSLPYMNGWYALSSLSLIKHDLIENKDRLKKQLDVLDNKEVESADL